MSKLSRTGFGIQSHRQKYAQKIQGPDLGAEPWLVEQQENKAHAAQWLLEVPGPQHQGA